MALTYFQTKNGGKMSQTIFSMSLVLVRRRFLEGEYWMLAAVMEDGPMDS